MKKAMKAKKVFPVRKKPAKAEVETPAPEEVPPRLRRWKELPGAPKEGTGSLVPSMGGWHRVAGWACKGTHITNLMLWNTDEPLAVAEPPKKSRSGKKKKQA